MTDAHRDDVCAQAATRYRLTPAVRRVLRALLDGVPQQYLDRELGVSRNTVKTHLSRLTRSTGSRPAELVWLLRGWPTASPSCGEVEDPSIPAA